MRVPALRALQVGCASHSAHPCSVLALCWAAAEHLLQWKRIVTSLCRARVGGWD